MDFRGLKIFVQVAELGSFTKAGEILGYSQPTVSFQIKQLEEETGTRLFDRIGHTVRLTDAGKETLIYAQQICRLSEKMKKSSKRDENVSGMVRIATADSMLYPLIARSFGSFRKKYPGISVKIVTGGTDEIFDLLDHNQVDLLCTLDEHIYDNSYKMVGEEKFDVHFAVSSESRFADRKEVEIEELMDEPFILTEKGMSYRSILDRKLAGRNLEIRPVLETGRVDIISMLVAENTGISVLPDFVTEEMVEAGYMKRLRVRDFDISVYKQLIYHRDKWVSDAMRSVIEYLRL